MGRRLPNFICLGVQKGGTTTLQKLLEKHPSIFLPAGKELHFFSLYYSKGPAWYEEHFAPAGPRQCCGEITPYYLFHPQAPKRVKELLPQVRLIVLLRDPVERAISQYFHSRRLGFETLNIEEAFAVESRRLLGADDQLLLKDGIHKSHQEHSYISRSRYEKQVPRWLNLFSENQLLVLRSEDFFHSPEYVWEKVLKFLELSEYKFPDLDQPANSGGGESAYVSQSMRQHLRIQLKPTYKWVEKQFGLYWGY